MTFLLASFPFFFVLAFVLSAAAYRHAPGTSRRVAARSDDAEQRIVMRWAANPDSDVADLERELDELYRSPARPLSDQEAWHGRYTGRTARGGYVSLPERHDPEDSPQEQRWRATRAAYEAPDGYAIGGLDPVWADSLGRPLTYLPTREPARAAGAAMAVDMPGGCVPLMAAHPTRPRVDAIFGVQPATGVPTPSATLQNLLGARATTTPDAWVLVPPGATAIYEHNVARRLDLSDTVSATQYQEV